MKVPFLDLVAQSQSLQPALREAFDGVLSEAGFVGGRRNADFEAAFAQYAGASHCIGVGNGTDALEIVLEGLALPPGSEVVVPANSFIASSEAVSRAGHRVVFADVDATYTLDVKDVARRLTDRTAAIVLVHLYGMPCDVPALQALADQHGLVLLEDCAQAHGAEHAGRRVGSFGRAAAFSFYPGKVLGAFGDAGAITTSDAALAQRCRQIANHGRTSKYEHDFEGRNSRLDALQAAVLSIKLPHLPAWLDRRREVARLYDEGLAGLSWLVPPVLVPDRLAAFHLYVVRVPDRARLAQHLADAGVQTGVHYPVALPQLAAYRDRQQPPTPNATAWADEVLSLPIGEHLDDDQVQHVVDRVRSYRPAGR